jgi:hypothetical protein
MYVNPLGMVYKEYYRKDLGKGGEMSLWKLYNLFTGANKSSTKTSS